MINNVTARKTWLIYHSFNRKYDLGGKEILSYKTDKSNWSLFLVRNWPKKILSRLQILVRRGRVHKKARWATKNFAPWWNSLATQPRPSVKLLVNSPLVDLLMLAILLKAKLDTLLNATRPCWIRPSVRPHLKCSPFNTNHHVQVLFVSGGSGRAPRGESTSTGPLSPSRFSDYRNRHLLDSDMQVLPTEVKEDYLRKACLLMQSPEHPQDALEHTSVGHHVPGHSSVGHHVPSWTPGHPSVGHHVAVPTQVFHNGIKSQEKQLQAESIQLWADGPEIGGLTTGLPSAVGHHILGHSSAGQVSNSFVWCISQHLAQVESGEGDPELLEHLNNAKRLLSSSSPTIAQVNFCAGSAAKGLQRSPSFGSRRAPTVASTSTRPSSTSWCCFCECLLCPSSS